MPDLQEYPDPSHNLKKCLAAFFSGAIVWCAQTFGGYSSEASPLVFAVFGVTAALLVGQVAESYQIAAFRKNALTVDRLMASIVFAIYVAILLSIALWSDVLFFASCLLAAYLVGIVAWAVQERRASNNRPSAAVMNLYLEDSDMRRLDVTVLRFAPLVIGAILFGVTLHARDRGWPGLEPLVFILIMFANLHRVRPRVEHGLFGWQYPYFIGWILLCGLMAAVFSGRLSPHPL